MAYSSRSPHVVGAHIYAKYGYDNAIGHISSNLASQNDDQNHAFWKSVLDVIEELHVDQLESKHPCAALKPRIRPQLHMNENAQKGH